MENVERLKVRLEIALKYNARAYFEIKGMMEALQEASVLMESCIASTKGPTGADFQSWLDKYKAHIWFPR